MRWPQRTEHRTLYYKPLDELTEPRDGMCVINRYWIVHPEHGLAFYGSGRSYVTPMCNEYEAVVNGVRDRSAPDHEVRLVPLAFLGHPSYDEMAV